VIEGLKAASVRERYVLLPTAKVPLEARVAWEQAARLPLCLLTEKMRIGRSSRRLREPRTATVILDGPIRCFRCNATERSGLFSIVPHSLLKFFPIIKNG